MIFIFLVLFWQNLRSVPHLLIIRAGLDLLHLYRLDLRSPAAHILIMVDHTTSLVVTILVRSLPGLEVRPAAEMSPFFNEDHLACALVGLRGVHHVELDHLVAPIAQLLERV